MQQITTSTETVSSKKETLAILNQLCLSGTTFALFALKKATVATSEETNDRTAKK